MNEEILDAVSARSAIKLTPGRHAAVARQIKGRLDPNELQTFGALIAEIENEALRATRLVRSRTDARNNTYGEASRKADAALDATLATFDALLAGYERAHDADTDIGRAARAIRARLLPGGLVAIVHASFPDEVTQVDVIIEDARRPEVAAQLRLIPGLSELVAQLTPRVEALRAALEREGRDGVSYRDALAATDRSEARLAELVAGITFHFRGDTPTAVARRKHLLEPYTLQVASMRDGYRRRMPTDVDPDTGAEVPVTTYP